MNRTRDGGTAHWHVFAGILILLVPAAQALAAKPPSLAQVKQLVEKHLSSDPDYAPGDLISREDVEPIFNEMLSLGVVLADNDEALYDDFIPSSAFLVELLHTERGRAFMRKVRSFPSVYDRLERLSWTRWGQDILHDLVDQPDGAVLFKAMLEPGGLKATASQIAADPRGKNYLLPTGHIYTASQLLKRLETTLARQPKAK